MDYISLSQLNRMVQDAVAGAFPDSCWVMAETSDVRLNANGHCYLEFIEKNPRDNSTEARARGYIWSSIFASLAPYFEQQTGHRFQSGLKVLVNVSVNFHPLYGYGLSVNDIDPAYTLGDMEQKRREIILKLEKEGMLDMNRELPFPALPQRVAIISSATAAGYEDFVRHLTSNSSGFVFYTRLFPAVMQGEQTEKSIIAALDKIYAHRNLFDLVVIIRGGGETSELSSFDSYLLAVNCAQFPLPVAVGIGHERDETVLDAVACHSAKTPTAVADFIISQMEITAQQLAETQDEICNGAQRILESTSLRLTTLASRLPLSANRLIDSARSQLEMR